MVLRLERAFWPLRVLLGMAVSLLIVMVVAVPSLAYVPASFEPAAEDSPGNEVTLSYSVVGGGDPAPGKVVEYTGIFTIEKMAEQGTNTTTTITVSADVNAPFASAVTAADFTGASSAPTSISCDPDNISCTVMFQNLADGAITFKKQARISPDAAAGAMIYATASIKTDVTPTLALEPGDVRVVNTDDRCVDIYQFETKVTGAGGWLLDIKFADESNGKILAVEGMPVNAAENPDAANTIRITDAAGVDITNDVLGKHREYRAIDPVPPTFPQTTTAPDARWRDSLNWNWDPTTWTGDTWLEAGTTITVRRQVSLLDCLPGRFAADGNVVRYGYDMAIEMARPLTSVDDFAMVSLRLPGGSTSTGAVCEQNIYWSQTKGQVVSTSEIGYYTPSTNTYQRFAVPVIDKINPFSDAIAVTQHQDGKIFYNTALSRTGGNDLWVYDGTRHSRVMALPGGTNSLGFDKDGNLWTITGTSLNKLAWDGQRFASSWQQVATLGGLDPNNPERDLVFDGDGNLYVLTGSGSILVTYSSAAIAAGGVASPTSSTRLTLSPSVTGSIGNYGIAFNQDGDLIISNSYQANTNDRTRAGYNKIYTVDLNTGVATVWIDGYYSPRGAIADLATCNFPSTAVKDGVQVQKSVINADGTVTEPGTTGTRITVDNNGNATVRYLVQVTNVGEQPATFPAITDSITVPAGFTIEDVLLDGQSQGDSGNFTIPGESLNGGAVRSYVVTLKVKADFNTADWASAGVCETSGGGTPGKGLFNKVTMDNDLDGDENNDACVPVEEPKLAKLTLIKDIDGGPAGDARFFTLTALGPTSLAGESPNSGDIAVSSNVKPGSYRLAESANHAGAANYRTGTWTCDSAKVPDTNGAIRLVEGDDVTCRINNIPTPPVHVVKTPSEQAPAEQNDPVGDNPHIGTAVEPDPEGRVTMKYTITVTNDGTVAGETGPVNEYFRVPAGLIWEPGTFATVTFDANGTGAVAEGFDPAKTYTAADLQNGYTLATAIKNLQPGDAGQVTFRIEIPLMLDNSESSTFPGTVFEQHAEILGQCVNTSTRGAAHTNSTMGVPNVTSIWNENQDYSVIPTEDNLACIPVVAPKLRPFSIEKQGLGCDVNVDTCQIPGAQFVLYETDPATNGAQPLEDSVQVDPQNGALFTTTEVRNGHYWIVETQAPDGFQLLAAPIHVEMTDDGLVLHSEGLVEITGEDKLTLVVSDVIKGDLPASGGPGRWVFLAAGVVLLAAAGIHHTQTSVRRRRE